MDWTFFWKLMLIVMIGLFAAMAVAGTVFGARDVKRLLTHLKNPDEDRDREETQMGSNSSRNPN